MCRIQPASMLLGALICLATTTNSTDLTRGNDEQSAPQQGHKLPLPRPELPPDRQDPQPPERAPGVPPPVSHDLRPLPLPAPKPL